MKRYEVKMNLWCAVEADSKREAKDKVVEALYESLHGDPLVTEAWVGYARETTEAKITEDVHDGPSSS